jgi:hypothetical protein
MAAAVAITFSAAVTGQTTATDASLNEGDFLPRAEPGAASSDGSIYVHKKLMQVALSNSGAPVIRFVDCRHQPKEQTKLVQISVTSDRKPLFRLVPGDYCLFTSTPRPSRSPASIKLSLPSVRVEEGGSRPDHAEQVNAAPGPGTGMTTYQQYVCEKFGTECGIALAIQSAENAQGACEIYHYNSNGTLDWGYFQINTVHLRRPGLNLRDLLDCKTNIDFAYQLFREKGFEPWTTYTSGAYRKFLRPPVTRPTLTMAAELLTIPRPLLRSE